MKDPVKTRPSNMGADGGNLESLNNFIRPRNFLSEFSHGYVHSAKDWLFVLT